MAHDINAMVYVGATPWHGLGTRLPQNGTWEEVREAAGFYTAVEAPIFLPDGKQVPDRKALLRGDDGRYLATVGDGYTILQFEELAEAGVRAAGGVGAIWHTAGTLGPTGARGWLLGELPHPITVKGDVSEVRKYVLLTTSHDGLSAAILKNIATRVVCRNTLGVALGEQGAQWTIRHTRNAAQRLKAASEAFAGMVHSFKQFEELANVMAATRFGFEQHARMVDVLFPIPQDDKKHPRLENVRGRLSGMFDTFIGAEGIRGTAWGSFQAVTEFVDHSRRPVPEVNDGGKARAQWEAKVDAITLGTGAALKARALAHLVEATGIAPASAALALV